MHARWARWSADSPPPGSRSPQHATKSEIKLSAAASVLLRGRESPARNRTGGCQQWRPAPHPQPCPRGHLPLGLGFPVLPRVRGRVVRALSLGRKRKRADGRGALARRLLCGDPRRRAPGVGAAGAESTRLTSPARRRTHSGRAQGAAGAKATGSPGIHYCAGTRAPARVPEPPIPPAGSRERARGARGASRLRSSAPGTVWGELRGRGGGDR